mmetsp:Transcript_23983/g.51458  ORF Transcript_23983/g.51458 Transcript_23983/m.51458 type:complete len:205 (+) Transcript_23983:399-1013(+)
MQCRLDHLVVPDVRPKLPVSTQLQQIHLGQPRQVLPAQALAQVLVLGLAGVACLCGSAGRGPGLTPRFVLLPQLRASLLRVPFGALLDLPLEHLRSGQAAGLAVDQVAEAVLCRGRGELAAPAGLPVLAVDALALGRHHRPRGRRRVAAAHAIVGVGNALLRTTYERYHLPCRSEVGSLPPATQTSSSCPSRSPLLHPVVSDSC